MFLTQTTRALHGAAACALVLAAAFPARTLGDDAELYQGASYEFGSDFYANVLFIIDTSGSMETVVDEDGDGTIESGERTRMQIVKDVTTSFLNELQYVNVGLMRFDSGYSVGGAFNLDNFREGGGMVIHAIEDIGTARSKIIGKVNALTASGTTQLSETMFEAASYLMGWPVYFGNDTYAGDYTQDARPEAYTPSVPESRDGDTYVSPVGQCQTTHLVYLTDGQPQFDSEITDVVPTWPGFEGVCTDNPDWAWSGFNVDGDGDCLDDIAAYLFQNDLYGDETDGFQNVITHTIGFFQDNDLLADTAARGGGTYYLADDADSLLSTLEAIFVDVNETGTTFTSPGVSVNAFDRTTHLDQLYYSVFQATGTARWVGNLKRYRLGETDGGAFVVKDVNGAEAVDQNTGFFRENSQSWWSGGVDGFAVGAGGAAEQIGADRNTLTELGGVTTWLKASNPDVMDYLSSIVDYQLIEHEGDDAAKLAALLDWVHGRDVKDEDGDGNTLEARRELGDPMHSEPLVVTYGPGTTEPEAVVLVGANDGFLHAFDSLTGQEISALMPFELLPRLDDWFADREVAERVYGVDGPIAAWVKDGGDGTVGEGDSVYVYFGLRRGGEYYYAFDYTNPAFPALMWKLSKNTPGFEQLGQSWSPITRTRVKTGTFGSAVDQDVLVFGGGYDERQDNYSAWAPDTKGNAIYMVNAYTGELVWSASAANTADTTQQAYFPEMTNAVTGQIRVLDLNDDGFADRLYAADLGGRVWRFDVHNPDAEGEFFNVTGGVLASLGGAASATASDNRRFYYAPDIALGAADGENFFNVVIASGYRAHPKDAGIADHFYVIRDYYPFAELGLSEDPAGEYVARYGFTHDDLSDISVLSTDPDALVPGFRMPLTAAPGEKVLSEARIFQNKATFTSYLPENELTQGCFTALGGGQLYSIDLGTGGVAVEALDKPGIPPEVVYVFTDDEETGYVPPTCFGDDCPDTSGEGDEGDGTEDETLADGPARDGRDIGCVIGPESCDAAVREVPVKTFWRQLDTDDID
jgi:type IV pilus assembly protein PilY1